MGKTSNNDQNHLDGMINHPIAGKERSHESDLCLYARKRKCAEDLAPS